jgi:hypothetical protein
MSKLLSIPARRISSLLNHCDINAHLGDLSLLTRKRTHANSKQDAMTQPAIPVAEGGLDTCMLRYRVEGIRSPAVTRSVIEMRTARAHDSQRVSKASKTLPATLLCSLDAQPDMPTHPEMQGHQ